MKHYFNIINGKEKPRFMKNKELLDKKISELKRFLKSCELCEHRCKVNRLKSELGFCKVGLKWRIFGMHPHLGEESVLIPSGTIFAAGCTMKCVYCQNAPESMNPGLGKELSNKEVAEWINSCGCKNVNFVGGDPTPYLLNILETLKYVKIPIPIIFNSNAYYTEKTATILKDIIDLYLLDFRYFNEECAIELSSAPKYVKAAKRNHLLANGDLIIRVLVMPGHIECDAKPILRWIKANLKNAYVNVLAQYRPEFRAYEFDRINRALSYSEYKDVVSYAKELGLRLI